MQPKLRSYRPSHATVVAYLALFVALGGSSYAAVTLKENSVKAKQIAKDAVGASEIKKGAVGTSETKNLLAEDFKAGEIPAGPQGPKGDTGPQGLQGVAGTNGANGATNVVARSQNSTPGFEQNQAEGTSVFCQAGERAVGGGLSIAGHTEFADWRVVVSEPAPLAASTPTGWNGTIYYTGAIDPDAIVTTTVICASP